MPRTLSRTVAVPPSAPDLPRSVWRRLLTRNGLACCSPVLVAAPDPLRVAEWLASFSFDVFAVSDDPAAVLQGRRDCRPVDFQRLGSDPRLPAQQFAAAFLLPLSLHSDQWLSLSARLLTAGLAAAVQPGGMVVTWRPVTEDGHEEACWSRHLGCFPGRVETTSLSLQGGVPGQLSIWRLPPEPLTLRDWQTYARRGLLTDRGTCCARAREALPLRRAA